MRKIDHLRAIIQAARELVQGVEDDLSLTRQTDMAQTARSFQKLVDACLDFEKEYPRD